MNIEVGQIWRDCHGNVTRIREVSYGRGGKVYRGALSDPGSSLLIDYAECDLVELLGDAGDPLERLTDNARELGLLDEMLSPETGTYTVFSTSKTYDSEAEAREAALKFAATGGVWHVAKLVGKAVPQRPVWEEA